MRIDLAGRTALVTGATSGIGRAAAVALGGAGAHVLVVGRDITRGAATVRSIVDAGGSAEFLGSDLSSARGARELAVDALRCGQVDVLVNNAAIFPFGTTAAVPDEVVDAVMTLNVQAPHILVGTLAPAMVQRRHGAIVNVTAVNAERASAVSGLYGSSKAALNLLTKAWAVEYGHAGVRVNAVSPGLTHTDGTEPLREMLDAQGMKAPLGRAAEPDEIAAAITFLASDLASFITGAVVPVDGGLSACLIPD